MPVPPGLTRSRLVCPEPMDRSSLCRCGGGTSRWATLDPEVMERVRAALSRL